MPLYRASGFCNAQHTFKSNGKFKNLDQRVYLVDYKYAFISIDTVDITIPAIFKVESMPKNVDVDNQFGKLQHQV